MICPACKREIEMAYSVLSHSFICSESDCGLEMEMDPADIETLIGVPADDPVPEQVYA